MSKKTKNKDIVNWEFAKDVDITIGEEYVSNLPKILLVLLVVLLISCSIAAYYFQDVIYDFIVQPEVVLKEEEITINVGDTFDAEEYIAKLPADGLEPDRYEITIPKNTAVNTNKVDDYRVVYSVKVLSNDKVKETELLVHVVDIEAPVITLTEYNITLQREVDTFKCLDYFDKVKDNYTDEQYLKSKLSCSDNIDWKADSYVVDYITEDKSGNIGVASLEITIKDKPKPSYQCWNGTLAWTAAECPARPQSNSGGNSSSGNTSSGGSSSSGGQSSSGGNSSSGGGQSSTPAASTPYINCASCSVAVGDLGALSACLSNTSSNVTIGIDYSSVNLSQVGSYSVSVYAIDGSISKSCGVTVHD